MKKAMICICLAVALAVSACCLTACGNDAVRTLTVRGQTEYIVGDVFAGAEMTVVYENGRREQVTVTAEMMSGFDTSVAGVKTVIVEYGGKVAEFVISVSDLYVSSMAIAEDSVTDYVKGSAYADGDASVVLMYTDGSTETKDVTADMLTGFDTSEAGDVTVSVAFGKLTATYEISVREPLALSAKLNSDTRLTYRVGDEFDSVLLDVDFEDGTKSTVTIDDAEQVVGFDTASVGERTLSVSFRGATVTFEVEVLKGVSSVALADGYDSLYGVGDPFGFAELELTYTDGTNGTVPVTEDMLTEFDTSKSGESEVVIDFEGRQTLSYEIFVAGRLTAAETTEEGAYKMQAEDDAYVDMSGAALQSGAASKFESVTKAAGTDEEYPNGAEGSSTANISVKGNKIVIRFIADAAGKFRFGMRAQSGSGSGKSDTQLSDAFSLKVNGGDKAISGTVKRATAGNTNWKDMTQWTVLTDVAGELDLIEGLNTIELTFLQETATTIRLPNIDYFMITPVA